MEPSLEIAAAKISKVESTRVVPNATQSAESNASVKSQGRSTNVNVVKSLTGNYDVMTVKIHVNKLPTVALIDTGCLITIISQNIFNQLRPQPKIDEYQGMSLIGTNSKPLLISGVCPIMTKLAGSTKSCQAVAADVAHDIILGNDILDSFNITLLIPVRLRGRVRFPRNHLH